MALQTHEKLGDSLTIPRHHRGTILDRLQAAISRARRLGYLVRLEPLGGCGTTWCEIAGRIHLFVDLSETAGEQLSSINGILSSGPTGSSRSVSASRK